MLNNLSEMT
ncbi:hypothetical protein YPPY103_1837, partial [Yersinia pestis PY-103]